MTTTTTTDTTTTTTTGNFCMVFHFLKHSSSTILINNIYFLSVACYFGGDYVSLVDGGQRQIKNLKVGDRVWSLDAAGTTLVQDEIIVIPHAGPSSSSLSRFSYQLFSKILI